MAYADYSGRCDTTWWTSVLNTQLVRIRFSDRRVGESSFYLFVFNADAKCLKKSRENVEKV